MHGLPLDAASDALPRNDYDPQLHSLTQRERAKAAELVAAGHRVTASTVKHRRQRYQSRGLLGLVDRRVDKKTPAFGRVDARLVQMMRTAIGEASEDSSRTVGYILWRTEQLLAGEHGPGGSRCHRGEPSTGCSTGSRTGCTPRVLLAPGQSMANRPDGPFGELPASAPGELMQIDSTPLDVLVRPDDGIATRVDLTGMIVDLTGMIDVATRTVTAAVLRPTTKSVDASVLLARTLTPEPMRPGGVEALAMSRSVLPYQRLLTIDERLEHAAARPVIIPETIVCDHGKVFVFRNFRASCRFLGINFQPAHEGTPTDKPHIERTLGSVATCSPSS